MRFLFVILFLTSLNSCKNLNPNDEITFADNVVIAHRGAWKQHGLPENSIASLKHAIALNCTGSEFDVRMTADDVLILNHDNVYHELLIEETNYEELAKFRLSNGEVLPTLRDFILAGIKDNTTTGLVCEIKTSKSKERGQLIAKKVVELVNELNAGQFVASYISFDYDILKRIIELEPQAKTQYLNGTKTPEELHVDGISGLDYERHVLLDHPEWIQSAKELGLTLNVWTVNNQEDMDVFLANGFDFISTNEPELLFERASASPLNSGYKLVWSDEFNYNGKPDPTKWTYDYGFVANQEKQYYVDSLKNARVDNGHLIIEAHKEKVANKDYKNAEIKGWVKYKAEIDTAQYTSSRLKTEGLVEWKYGRIEVRAKLPKGRGMWPAIWMLGENRKEIGWPECGEIDIMEHVGYDNDTIHGTIHTKAYNHIIGTQKGKTIFIENPNEEFHVFVIEWTPGKIDFLLDGVVYNHIENEHKTTAEWPFDQNFYLILNVAVGGGWGGRKGIDDSIFPQQMIVDYVRVYQKLN
ncbi:family 16 glycosylhydrolase [Maribacter polysaccharolyticus]|uniref:family 16 glycosylhydrolase n=1 Tax=Maribacter polysaccharolyticus TaxID=3020831 RepID=UPI00237F0FC8|nr:family 16 glycosylhydrolase [Maribacter polysaccharolyticus]MDE3741165.1 family 16 glycosylhydrolase [Maribacter polysaccharolyticus]